jgi:broad specificity phosphatase PhoE
MTGACEGAAFAGCRPASNTPTLNIVDRAAIPLLFVRHGQTTWTRAGRYQGRSDPPLAPEGDAEAEALAERLQGEAVGVIMTSPLRRAVATARILARRLGVAPARIDGRLIEIAYGAWEGLTQSEVRSRWPEQLRLWKREPEAMRFPQGESLGDVRLRLLDFLRDAAAGADGRAGSLLVVTHAGPIRIAALAAARRPLAHFRRVEAKPAEAYRFSLQNGLGTDSGAVALQEVGPCVL